jgi:hypothetical protein
MKNPDLWKAIKHQPPSGWQAYETAKLGKYLDGPEATKMGYRRFCNVCGEERNKVKPKITG